MNQHFIISILVCVFSLSATFGQDIKGVIIESDTKQGIPGANVVIKGTTRGAITNLDGAFVVGANIGDTLVCSYIGMESEEVVVTGSILPTIELKSEAIGISEVVVTALGIVREEKALGYSIQDVSGDDIAQAKELDVVNSLSGKIAGVNITKGSGSLGGGGARVVIRGETSLSGTNEPIFIIDGLRGNANDVATDDIASISVLKGPAAAALYGSEGGAGVIIITTKRGNAQKGIGIEVSSNYMWQSTLVLPEYQNQFGQGKSGLYQYYDGNNGGNQDDTNLSWGPEFDARPRNQFSGYQPWVAHTNNVKNFYQTGLVQQNHIAASGGNETGNFRLGYTNIREKGIVPNTGITTNRVDFSSGWNFNKNLKITAAIKYINTDCANNRSYDPRFIPRNIDFEALEDYWVPGLEGKQQLKWRYGENNPYFVLYENQKGYLSNRFVGRLSVNYTLGKHLTFAANYGYNNNYNEKFDNNAISTGTTEKQRAGYHKNEFSKATQQLADFLVSYERDFSVFYTKFSAGGSHQNDQGSGLSAHIDELLFPNLYTLKNHNDYPYANNWISEKEVNSLYAFINMGYASRVYLDITGRNDWASTLSPQNNSFFYPSAAMSVLPGEFLNISKSIIPFWKIRASVAEVGNPIKKPYWVISGTKYQWSQRTTDGVATVKPTPEKIDPDIKPEKTLGWEFGTDIRFLKNRLGLDVTYYNSKTVNQIIPLEKSITSEGEGLVFTNGASIQNYGFEVMLNAVPVKTTGGFQWKTQLNWSYDRAILRDIEVPQTRQVNSFLFLEDHEGQRRGTFYGKGYARSPQGDMLLSLSGDTRRGQQKVLGNYNPDWMASLINTFSYKALSFKALFDYRKGAQFYSNTLYKLNIRGLSAETAYNNRENIVPDGVVEDGNGGYRKLTLDDMGGTGLSGEQYWANMMDEEIPEAVIVNGTYLKLRELVLSYTVPQKWLEKVFINSASVSLVGRNLYVWTNVKHVDPETFSNAKEGNGFGENLKIPGYENSGSPSLRSYGFNIKLNF